jgi:hypothetical protein
MEDTKLLPLTKEERRILIAQFEDWRLPAANGMTPLVKSVKGPFTIRLRYNTYYPPYMLHWEAQVMPTGERFRRRFKKLELLKEHVEGCFGKQITPWQEEAPPPKEAA